MKPTIVQAEVLRRGEEVIHFIQVETALSNFQADFSGIWETLVDSRTVKEGANSTRISSKR